jgi:mono/diheme cytochrome c family protein
MKLSIAILLGSVGALWGADLERGAAVVRDNHCLECHSARGVGARSAPDFSGQLVERYTPAALASAMWNHTPQMWNRIGGATFARPALSDGDNEALFAYLYSLRFANASGAAKRGDQVFDKKGCAGCHEIAQWRAPQDPWALAQQMWNHSGVMTATAAKQARERPTVTAQDLADITAFAREARSLAPAPDTPSIPSDLDQLRVRGKQGFDANCRSCHSSGMALERRLANRTYSASRLVCGIICPA